MQISIPELLIKGIPEGFLDVLSIYILTGTKIKAKTYVLQSIVTVAVIFLIRFLPINYGINTILVLTFFAVYFSVFFKMEFTKVIMAAIFTIIIIFLCEMINVYLLKAIFGSEQTKELLQDALKKSVFSIPSTVMFAASVFIEYLVMKRIGRRRKVRNGETGGEIGP